MPAVSTSFTGMPPMATVSLTRSRVVPGMAVTMARSCSTKRLNKLDLPDIWTADDGQGQTFMNNLAVGEGCCQSFKWRSNFRNLMQDCFCGKDGHVVFREINSGLEQSDEFHQLLFDRLQSPREAALQLLGGHFCLVESLRLDEVADRFGLGQIDAAI